MTTPEVGSVTAARIGIVKSLALLAVGLLPWPADWDNVRDVIDSARSPELNRAERDGQAYGLLRGPDRRPGTARIRRVSDVASRLIGKPERLGSVQASKRRAISRW